MPRIAVTGIGLRLASVGKLTRFDTAGHACHAAAELAPFRLDALRNPKNEKYMRDATRAAVRAALDAVSASAIDLPAVDPRRIAVYVGSGETGLDCGDFFPALAAASEGSDEANYARMGGRASRLLDPYFSLQTLSNAGTALIAAELDARGPSNNFVQSDVASALALEAAWYDLAEGRCDVAVAGGCDSLVNVSTYLTYERAGLLSRGEYRPFDRRRDGLVLGEGAGFLVMERLDDALARGAPIEGELAGIGSAAGGDDALERAIAAATQGETIDAIFAHGIGTIDGDRREAELLRRRAGDAIPVTALKSRTGYVGAATAAVEAAFALIAVRDRMLPAIAGFAESELSLDFVAEPRAIASRQPLALSLARSWTGQVTAVAMRNRS